jgi:hypothetical protein
MLAVLSLIVSLASVSVAAWQFRLVAKSAHDAKASATAAGEATAHMQKIASDVASSQDKQAREQNKLVAQIAKGVETSITALRLDQRPWLVVQKVEVISSIVEQSDSLEKIPLNGRVLPPQTGLGVVYKAHIVIHNFGRTPANHVFVEKWTEALEDPRDPKTLTDGPEHLMNAESIISLLNLRKGGSTVVPGMDWVEELPLSIDPPQESAQPQDRSYYDRRLNRRQLRGVIKYKDLFGNLGRSDFCFSFEPAADGVRANQCPSYNDVR